MKEFLLLNAFLVFSPAALGVIGYLLDVSTYYHRRAIYDACYRWWYSLSELTLSGINSRIVELMVAADNAIFGKAIFSLRSALVILVLDFLLACLVPALPHKGLFVPHLDLFFASRFCLLIFPVLLGIVLATRVLIRFAAKKKNPRMTVFMAVLLLDVVVISNLALARLTGCFIMWLPTWEYGRFKRLPVGKSTGRSSLRRKIMAKNPSCRIVLRVLGTPEIGGKDAATRIYGTDHRQRCTIF